MDALDPTPPMAGRTAPPLQESLDACNNAFIEFEDLRRSDGENPLIVVPDHEQRINLADRPMRSMPTSGKRN